MADMNRGLDLSVFETATDAESGQFRSFYADKLGTPHRGLNFWLDVGRPAVFFDGWAADPGALRTGMDFSAREVLDGEMDLLDEWYLRTIGEIPPYVGFLRQHRPRLLKSWRNRYENILVELPKQVMPYTQLHFNVMCGWGDGGWSL